MKLACAGTRCDQKAETGFLASAWYAWLFTISAEEPERLALRSSPAGFALPCLGESPHVGCNNWNPSVAPASRLNAVRVFTTPTLSGAE